MGEFRRPPRRPRRLSPSAYAAEGAICSLTLAVAGRQRTFANPAVTCAAIKVLREHSAAKATPIYAYCFMPDHVHLLLGPSANCDIVTFVGQFKNLAQRAAWQNGVEGSFWQKSFWDHFLRAEEDLRAGVEYILNNPVRSGLVAHWNEYPFSGSLVFEL